MSLLEDVLLASGNPGKLREFEYLLKPLGFQVQPQAALGIEDIEETGLSFVENALLKARHAAQKTGLPALADDSGLVVDALQGAPGLYSARYAGGRDAQANNELLLKNMQPVPTERRSAYFYCCIVWLRHALDPVPLIAEARWQGRILHAPQGEQGFGYDPIFYVPEFACSAAELSPEDKSSVSHRAQAFTVLQSLLSKERAV